MVFFSTIVFAQNKSFTKDSIEVSGQVIGFKPGSGDDFINFKIYDLRGSFVKHSFQLNKEGKFSVKLYQPFAGDIEVNYRNVYETLYIPSKRLIIEIQNDKIINNYISENTVKVRDEESVTNALILKFKTAFKNHKFLETSDFSNFDEIDSVFANKRHKQLKEELEFLKSFNTEGMNDLEFRRWQQNQLIYTAANEIITFPFYKRNNKNVDEKQIIGLLKRIPLDNESAINNSVYYSFLNALTTDFRIIVALNPKYELLKLENGKNSFPIYLNMVDSLSKGLARDLMYYNLYPQSNKYNADHLANQYWDKFNDVKDTFIKNELNNDKLKLVQGILLVDIIDKLNKMPINTLIKSKLISIFEKEKGNNLYIDFWGDWCIPCMKEMPNYPNFINELKDEPIKFIFFSVNTTKESMEEIKNKNKINGTFYNLTNDEIAVLNNVFEFQGYPSHFLINDKGLSLGMVAANLHSLEGVKSTANLVKQTLNKK